MAWREARVQTSEDALTPFIHPRILAPQSRARSLLWHEDWAREWFHGDEEDRRRQEAMEIQAMQKDLVQRQAAEARIPGRSNLSSGESRYTGTAASRSC